MVVIQKRINENKMIVNAKKLEGIKDPVVHMSDLKLALDPINKRLDYLTKLLVDHINKTSN